MPVAPLALDGRRDVRRGDPVRGAGRHRAARVRDLRRADRGRRWSRSARRSTVCRSGIELAAARMAAMSAVEVCDRLGDRLPAADRTGVRARTVRRRCSTRSPGPTTCSTTTSARCCGRRRCSRAASTCTALCAVAGTADDVEVLRLLDSLVRKSLVVAHHGSDRTRYSLFETIRAFAEEQLSPATGDEALRDRHAAHFASEAVGALGAVERPRVAAAGRLGARRAGQPAVGVPVERRPRPGDGGDRRRRPRGADGVLRRAVRDHRVGGGAARRGRPGRRTTAPAPVRRGRLRLLRRAGRGGDRERPPGRRAGVSTRATSRASPATRRSSRRSGRSTAATSTATSS